jgi:hypothetical protein
MKTRTVIVLAAVVVTAMIAEWQFVTFITEARVIHGNNGLCNGGVGRPYADFIRQLRTLAENGDTDKLATALRRADERSRDIYEVWLANKQDAYKDSIREILK